MSVLRLYRRLLRLHQRLPDDTMATIGRQFVREEFRKHKGADSKFVVSFMKEWTVNLLHTQFEMPTAYLRCIFVANSKDIIATTHAKTNRTMLINWKGS